MSEIKGKIVRILSDTTVVINKGLSDGVGYSMEFIIYEYGDPVADPGSREMLERIELIKERVFVTHIQERICIAETSPVGINLDEAKGGRKGTGRFSAAPSTTIQPKLNVDPADISAPSNAPMRVQIGDFVRNIER